MPSTSSGQRASWSAGPWHTGASGDSGDSGQDSESQTLITTGDGASAGPSTSTASESFPAQAAGGPAHGGKRSRRHRTLLRLGDVNSPHYLNLTSAPDWRRLKWEWSRFRCSKFLFRTRRNVQNKAPTRPLYPVWEDSCRLATVPIDMCFKRDVSLVAEEMASICLEEAEKGIRAFNTVA
ncbi:hypothetical protein, conserved [Eimeria necatrix]|uniref:Uncharacterized protein n=1 Tax=Eimeria necatrix TaxID=51315 RepID=U6MSP1_9EIME|nr:hypothetical protein, conserved [Eimeria necatrix]CDJ67227.1 hypothetical protein, conserved [Eimeria necatrix]